MDDRLQRKVNLPGLGKINVVPSILAADYMRLGEQTREAQAAGVKAIQIDVMDGRFVPNITFGQGIVRALRRELELFLDVHLMIVEPEKYLEEFAEAGADRLIVHQETCPNLHSTLGLIRELGVEAGVCLNPGTPVTAIEEVLDRVDLVQVMTVNPGFGGQEFIMSQLGKIERLRKMLDYALPQIPIAVDGGIDASTAPLVVKAGASVLIAGSSVFNEQALVADNLAAIYASINKVLG